MAFVNWSLSHFTVSSMSRTVYVSSQWECVASIDAASIDAASICQSDSARQRISVSTTTDCIAELNRTGGCFCRSSAIRFRTGSPWWSECGSMYPSSSSHASDQCPRSSPGNHNP
jgi:hypothetical protein